MFGYNKRKKENERRLDEVELCLVKLAESMQDYHEAFSNILLMTQLTRDLAEKALMIANSIADQLDMDDGEEHEGVWH